MIRDGTGSRLEQQWGGKDFVRESNKLNGRNDLVQCARWGLLFDFVLQKTSPFSYAVFQNTNSFQNAFLVLATAAFALMGGVLSLVLTGTAFSISTSVGHYVGDCHIRRSPSCVQFYRISRRENYPERSDSKRSRAANAPDLNGYPWRNDGPAIDGRRHRDRGSQAQQPLARLVVGGMLTAAVLILMVLPILYHLL